MLAIAQNNWFSQFRYVYVVCLARSFHRRLSIDMAHLFTLHVQLASISIKNSFKKIGSAGNSEDGTVEKTFYVYLEKFESP